MTETSPAEWFGGRARVMFVHAHPDDETIATGGTLAALAEAGREPLLVTLTRGEQGEVRKGAFSSLEGTDGLAPHRQAELAAALVMLGLERHVFLGVEPARAEGREAYIYEDSGMQWDTAADGSQVAVPASHVGPDALTSVPAVEPLMDLLAAAEAAGAQAIVSYNDEGGYGHPDHVLAHRLSRAVAEALGLPFWEIVGTGGASVEPVPGLSEDDEDAPVIEEHNIEQWLPRKISALHAHGTQLAVDGLEMVHVGGQRQAIDTVEKFRLVPRAQRAE